MGRVEPAQGNRNLMEVDTPPSALPVELAKLNLSMLSKEACCYNVPYMNVTVGRNPTPYDKQGSTMTVVCRISKLTNRA